MVKTCSYCKTEKSISEFYISHGKSLSRCKMCYRLKFREYYYTHQEQEIKRTDKFQEKHGRPYSKTRRFKDAQNRASMKAYKNHKNKWVARSKLRYMVKVGKIEKMPCFCGEIQSQGHHYLGYEGEHWKDVKWLCAEHHALEHRKDGV